MLLNEGPRGVPLHVQRLGIEDKHKINVTERNQKISCFEKGILVRYGYRKRFHIIQVREVSVETLVLEEKAFQSICVENIQHIDVAEDVSVTANL